MTNFQKFYENLQKGQVQHFYYLDKSLLNVKKPFLEIPFKYLNYAPRSTLSDSNWTLYHEFFKSVKKYFQYIQNEKVSLFCKHVTTSWWENERKIKKKLFCSLLELS